jgi:peroxiredoxin
MKPQRFTTISLLRVFLAAATLWLTGACVFGARDVGPPTGSRFPAMKLSDQNGQVHTVRSLLGAKGAAILFYPPTEGCLHCSAQLAELEQHQEAFHKLGLGLAAVTSDSVATLKDFAARNSLHIPLLSGADSKTAGWVVLDARGMVVAKYADEDPSQYYTSAALLMHQFGWSPADPPKEVKGKQLTAMIASSNVKVAPGQRIALTLDVDLQPNLHVYAPGVDDYIPIEWKMEDADLVVAHAPEFPQAEKLFLKAINETVPTYQNRFRLTRDITIPSDDKLKPALDGSGHFAIASSLRYQACDDRMCYFPQTVHLQWTFEYQAHQ